MPASTHQADTPAGSTLEFLWRNGQGKLGIHPNILSVRRRHTREDK
jgi:hypothetical protein